MAILTLCADKHCQKHDSCYRYSADPIKEHAPGESIRVEPSLRQYGDSACIKYFPLITQHQRELS